MIDDDFIAGLFNANDANRYANGSKPKRFLSSGPGSYLVEVMAIKHNKSSKEGSFGVVNFVVEFRVIEAYNGLDENRRLVPATLEAGDTFGHVRQLVGRMPIKEALEMTAAILRLAPVVEIPRGFPHAGELLPLVTLDTAKKIAKDDGVRYKGRKVYVDINPSRGKDGSKHEGKVFFNANWSPASDDGERVTYPDFNALNVKSDMTQAINDYFGRPDAIETDDDIPF